MSPDSQEALHQGDSVNIGLVKDNTAKTGRLEGGEMSLQHKKSSVKFLSLSELEDWKDDAAYINEAENFILSCEVPS